MHPFPRGARLSTGVGGALVAALLLTSCGGVDPIESPPLNPGTADFARLAIIGDSFAAGFQSGGLVQSRQVTSFAYRFATQVGQAPGRFEIPTVASPGVPRLLEIQAFSPLTIAAPDDPGAPGNYQARFTNILLPRPYNNLAVPGATAAMALTTSLVGDPRESLFYLYGPPILRVQSLPLAMVDQAAALDPTFVLIELGINDVLQGVANGDPDRMTPLESVEASYLEVVSRATVAGAQASPASGVATVAGRSRWARRTEAGRRPRPMVRSRRRRSRAGSGTDRSTGCRPATCRRAGGWCRAAAAPIRGCSPARAGTAG